MDNTTPETADTTSQVGPLFTLIQDSSNYQPVPHETLPEVIQDAIGRTMVALCNSERGRVMVIGDVRSGKTFFVNHLAQAVSDFTTEKEYAPVYFIRVNEKALPAMMSEDGTVSMSVIIDHICDSLKCADSQVCVVTENPSMAAVLQQNTTDVKVILEAVTDTLFSDEAETAKSFMSWDAADTADMLLTAKETSLLVKAAFWGKAIDMYPTDEVDDTIIDNLIRRIVRNDTMTQKDGKRKVLNVPFGQWGDILTDVTGTVVMSKSKRIREADGSISIKGLTKYIIKQNRDILENSEDEGLVALAALFGGDTDSSQDVKKRKKRKPLKFNSLKNLKTALSGSIIGQEKALDAITRQVTVPMSGMSREGKPLRSLMFCGPTGTGKTETAKVIAKHLLKKGEMNLVRIDMSEFAEKHEYTKLLGAPPGYVGYETGGVLTRAVAANPRSVVLLDEVEKAHPDIWNQFLQILDAGRMTDSNGQVVDFTQTIIIMTSNLGAAEMSRTRAGFVTMDSGQAYTDRERNATNAVMRSVEKTMLPELINRIDEIIVFSEIRPEAAREIAVKEIKRIRDTHSTSVRTIMDAPHDIVDEILKKSNISKYGVREIQRTVEKMIVNPLATAIATHPDGNTFTFEMSQDGQVIVRAATEESD